MAAKLTTKEIVVRMLLANGIGNWMFGYELQGKATPWGFSGVDADTRAHELSREGHYDSPTARYIIGHRKQGKYAQFRIVERQSLGGVAGPDKMLNWFEALPSKPQNG
jgi:hypothetical protein